MAEEKDTIQTDENNETKTGVAATTAKRKLKGGRLVPTGVAYIIATFNNTKVTITDPGGKVLSWSSAGKAGFKGSRKSTAYAAQLVAQDAINRAIGDYGMNNIEARIKGPGPGRESAVRGLVAAGVEVTSIKDITPVPHNGCRPPKRRRI